MRMPNPAVVDIEGHAIEMRPDYPPKLTGVSIQLPSDKKPRYWSFGHPSGNNCTKAQAAAAIREAYRCEDGVLFQNAKFDVDVIETHMGIKPPAWDRIHDDMYLLFLNDPHQLSLELKWSAQKLLGMNPEEKNAVQDWLVEHGVIDKRKRGSWGEHIAECDGVVVGNYGNGDVIRTKRLFNKLYPKIVKEGMLAAYNTERELMPILLENERAGVRVDLKRLRRDIPMYEKALERCDDWLRQRLKSPGMNVDSDAEIGDALHKSKIITEWVLTPTGKRSVAKKNMPLNVFRDVKVAAVYGYRMRLATCLRMFMLKWMIMAEKSGGYIYTSWNQVRQTGGDGNMGARTGRLSSTPNLQNLSKNWYDRDDFYRHPTFLNVPELPLVRVYILPDEGHSFIHRDYNQQELRIFAHFEDGALLKRYKEDPTLDVHVLVQKLISGVLGREIERRPIKILNFGKIYGEGLKGFAARTQSTLAAAREIDNAHNAVLPGIRDLMQELKETSKAGEPIVTWGGRNYYVEPARPSDDGSWMREFHYKLLNYLIQGSASDCTKRAIIDYHKAKKHGRFLITVHDENNTSAPIGKEKQEHKILKECMENVRDANGKPFDLPMLSDGKTGKNWAELKPHKD